MIEPYYGEFLINPIPLELSLNYCSHKCVYCFSNLNKPGRKLDAPRLMRFIQDYKNRQTLAAQLLQAGYPVLISNRVDPFANSNYLITLPILEVLVALKIPMALQTKGGRGINEALQILPPSVWYISIALGGEELRQKLEPGAPPLTDRLGLIEQLTGLGHKVIVGVNPVVPEWLPAPAPLLTQLKDLGVWGVWIERLHFNQDQINNMSARERQAIGEPLIKRAKKRKPAPVDMDHYHLTRTLAQDIGLEIFSVGQANSSNFFLPYRQCYSPTFPTMQDFINYCHHDDDRIKSFTDFWDFMSYSLPQGQFRLSHYIGATTRTLWYKYKVPTQMTYRQLLGLYWLYPEIANAVARLPCFAYAGQHNGQGWIQLVDETDIPYMVFIPEKTNDFYFEIGEDPWQEQDAEQKENAPHPAGSVR